MAKLVRLTGLPAQVIEDNDLQVDTSTFRKMLLHDQGLIIGRYDARITGRDASPASRVPRFDPSYAATYGPFSAAMNAYVRQELKFEDDLPYEILTGVQPWNFDTRNNYPSVAGRLASVISQNPHLRVLVLGSLRDLACPIAGERRADHLYAHHADEAGRAALKEVQGKSRQTRRNQGNPARPSGDWRRFKIILVCDVGNADDQHAHPAARAMDDPGRNVNDRTFRNSVLGAIEADRATPIQNVIQLR